MTGSTSAAQDGTSTGFAFCDRCARRARSLVSDELSSQELCPDCFTQLTRRRAVVKQPAVLHRPCG
jgi:hypothetical protein